MSELSVKMTGDEAELVSKILTVISKSKESREEFQRTASASDDAAKAAREAARQVTSLANEGKRMAQALAKENENLAEAYDRQAKALQTAHDEGKISADQLGQALGQLESKFEQQAQANREAAHQATESWKTQQREAKEGIAIVERFQRETKSLEQHYAELKGKLKAAWDGGKISSLQYADSLNHLEKEYNDVIQKNEQVANGNKNAFGSDAVNQITGMVASWALLSKTIGFARDAVNSYNEERNKGRSETEQLQDARRRLFQVSNGDFAALEQRADDASAKYGVDRGLARQVLFQARSEGFEDQYEEVIKLTPIIDPQSAATVAGQVRELFKSENVNVGEAVNAVLTGARKSRLDFEGITKALPQVGEGGRQQGAGMDESIAAVSVLASVFKSGETTGDRLKAFLSALSLNDQTKGKGLVGGFEALEGMDAEGRSKFLGSSQELNAVYAAMKDMIEDIKTRTGEISDARSASGSDQIINEFLSDPKLAGFQASEAAKRSAEIAKENAFSEGKSSNTEFIEFANQSSIKKGENFISRSVRNAVFGASDWLGLDSREVLKASRMTQDAILGTDSVGDAERRKQTKLLEKIATERPPEKPKPVITRPTEDQ